MYRLILQPEARKFLDRLFYSDRSLFDRVLLAIESLQKNPFKGKLLKLSLKGRFSLRVGMYRIIYTVEQNIVTVYVLKIGHRRDVYN